ncbi:MAG: aminopeptidase P family protein [Muribaculaceae bacterium]|nr:aminopeptidase P family protein [Muribaculaceae bacterium]
MSKETVKNLEALREAMRKVNVGAVIIPGTDPHQSEYVNPHWKVRDWVTGFTGSNGTAVVTMNAAGLWTDSRYFLQAADQLQDSGFDLHKEDIPGEATVTEWLAEQMEENEILAVDGRLFSIVKANQLEEFCGANGFRFATDFAPADTIWTDRPARPMSKAFVHDVKYAGEEVASKIERVLSAVEAMGADAIFIPALDEIAWTLNVRGADVECNPLVVSYLYLSRDEKVLFVDAEKIDAEVAAHLNSVGVELKPYDDVQKWLNKEVSMGTTVLLDPNKVSDTLARALECYKVYGASPVAPLKAIKNEVQIEGTRKAMERDGAALVRLWQWIEKMAPTGTINEMDVAEKAIECRSVSDMYRGESFGMIAGYKGHGAIVHYSASPESASTLNAEGLLLVDCGGQYLDGTTDITRTMSLGNPTASEKHDYTLVLKGHLAIGRAIFPVGTRGSQLDALARIYQWQEMMTYLHGTGHGVGHFLGVHEGPQNIRLNENPTTLKPGMITSNEPGLYKAGKYGIRTENLVLTVPAGHSEEFGDFLKFETLTLFPYDKNLIDLTMLSAEEVAQVNAYHAEVRSRLTPYLNEEEQAWLNARTEAI